MKRLKGNLSAAIFLIVLTSVSTIFLSFTNNAYEKVKAERQRDLRMQVYRGFGNTVQPETFDEDFLDEVVIREDKKSVYYFQEDGPLAALDLIGPGLWGEIELLIFLDTRERIITELTVLSQIETAGLGARIEEPWFQRQFSNLPYDRGISIVHERRGKAGEVDAISGATKTSSAVEDIINTGIERFNEMFADRLKDE